MMAEMGKMLVLVGLAAAVVGLGLVFAPKVPFLGRLPGDIVWKRGGLTVYFPLATCVVISLVLTFLLWLFGKR